MIRSGKHKVNKAHKPILGRFLNLLQSNGLEGMSIYYSYYRAFVHSIQDPENLGRLQLIIPDLTGDVPYEEWALPIGNFAGKGYGLQMLPMPGDIVWVSFEQGNPEFPLWQHGYFGLEEKPKEELLQERDAYFIKTPSGHFIVLNDTKNTILVQHKDGPSVEITEKAVSLISKDAISLGQSKASDQPAVLGDKNEQALKDLAQGIIDIVDAFTNASVLTDYTGAGLKASLIALTAQTKISMQSFLQSTAEGTKSKKVTLD